MESIRRNKDPLKTRFSGLNDSSVYQLFTEDGWGKISRDERLEALQEIECRMARKQGREACIIYKTNMKATQMGYFHGSKIVINSKLLADARSRFGMNTGQKAMQALDTILHEGRHAFQRAVVTGCVKADVPDSVRRTWFANLVNYAGVEKGYSDFAFYAFQPVERDAREYAARELAGIYRDVKKSMGRKDPFFEQGISSIRKDKEHEYQIVRYCVKSDEVLKRKLDMVQRLDICMDAAKNIKVSYMERSYTLAQCAEVCAVTAEYLKEMTMDCFKDIDDILAGEKDIADYLDGLDAEDTMNKIDGMDSASPAERFERLAAVILERAAKSRTDMVGILVRPDGKSGF